MCPEVIHNSHKIGGEKVVAISSQFYSFALTNRNVAYVNIYLLTYVLTYFLTYTVLYLSLIHI